ncbi:MAG TPA: NTF2 fold immunity protein [Chryseolinea sp.]
MRMNYLFVVIFACFFTACRQKPLLGRAAAEEQLDKALEITNDIVKPGRFLIDKKDDAVAIAEVYLFSAFGKGEITDQRPYEIYLIDHYWVMNGTLPLGVDGGNFELVLDAETGEVKRLVETR